LTVEFFVSTPQTVLLRGEQPGRQHNSLLEIPEYNFHMDIENPLYFGILNI